MTTPRWPRLRRVLIGGLVPLLCAVHARAQQPDAIGTFAASPATSIPVPEATPAGSFQPARTLTRAQMEYPTLAHLNRVEGVVSIRFFIDETGHVTRVAILKPGLNPLLDQFIGDPRLLQWTFQPATLSGKAVPSTHDQEFEFRLDPREDKRLLAHRLALAIGTPDPGYPPAAVASHQQGAVTISVRWNKEGLVGEIALVKSSGAPLLDATALRFAYENWRIDPAATKPDQPFVKTIQFTPP